jgi:hypothetical protein
MIKKAAIILLLTVLFICSIGASIYIGAIMFTPPKKVTPQWEKIPAPAGKPVKILSLDADNLYLQDKAGQVFACARRGSACQEIAPGQAPDGNLYLKSLNEKRAKEWYDRPYDPMTDRWYTRKDCIVSPPPYPDSAAALVQRYDIRGSWPDGDYCITAALFEDGSVWGYEGSSSSGTLAFAEWIWTRAGILPSLLCSATLTACTLAIWLVIGGFSIVLYRRRNNRQQGA